MLEPARSLSVPRYQRSFCWTKSEVDELWDDIQGVLSGDEASYFLGAMVFVEHDSVYEVVDGQQRLATLSLLFAAIRDLMKSRQEDDRAAQIEQEVLCRKDIETLAKSPILSLNITDNDTFRQIVDGDLGVSELKRMTHARGLAPKLLASAYVNYYDRLHEISSQTRGIQRLASYHKNLLDRIELIEITTKNDDSAYTLFETLNDRGLDLSLADLLKNYLFSRAKERLADVQQQWTETTTTVSQSAMTKFIRHEWMSRKGKVREADLYRKLKGDIQSPNEVTAYVRALRASAEIYAALADPDNAVWSGLSPRGRDLLRQIGTFKIVQCYPLLLAAWSTREPKDFESLARWILALTVRYTIIGGKGTGNLETVYAQSGPICRGQSKSLAEVKKVLLNLYPSNSEFELAFATKTLSETAMARLLLSELETHLSANAEKIASPDKLTLEHILPRSPGAGWPEALRGGPEHDELVSRLGNLTLLTPESNSSLPDDFAGKKRVYSGSALHITRMVAEAEEWNEEAIDARQRELARHAVKVWRIS